MKPGIARLMQAKDMLDRATIALCEHRDHADRALACIHVAKLRLNEAERELRDVHGDLGANLGEMLTRVLAE